VKDFKEICEVFPILRFQLNKADLGALADLQTADVLEYKMYMQGYHKFCKHHWRPDEIRRSSFPKFKGNNTGALLWGERGCGKSQVLAYTTAWAHEKSWINFTISGPEEFTNGKSELFRWKNGLYLQKELAQNVLSDFRHSNEQLLQDFEVDMSLYGKFDISGVKDGDPEPCPRTWDPKR
jgi:hypothetical protein